ncbi:SIR2 family protein [Staphylococcus equorum]|uniref:SIR2 family protein n=1 Tax=Staphylococcus equorum TaxID=246432 RepID=UPI0018679A12|nr:SIR2 family protein [Staphylococcus equorum]MEB7846610.1 SIR2 family protein [Staphylococcus equorum]
MKIEKEFINDIYDAEIQQTLLFFIGAGVSISQGYPDWNKYVDELIQYWKANLIKITEDNRTDYTRVNRNDYDFLDTLLNSSFSNKRKVDLVNHMIEKYSKSNNEEESIRIYNKYVLSFEKFFFQDMPPHALNNDILMSLTKLKANFITTNYDKSIEKNIELQGRDTINTYNDYSETPENLTYPSVMHIHGTPDSVPKFFVSSASSYNFIYLEKNNIIESMTNLFKKEKIYTIVFLGCSLEEEEIMNLLSEKINNIKLYALMKNNNNAYFNDIIKDYYNKKYNINIVWYGSDYKDLPSFLEEFINKVHQKKKLYNYEEVYKALTTNEEIEENINILNNVMNNGDYSKLNLSIKSVLSDSDKIKKIAINNLIKSNILTTTILKHTVELFNVWSLIANQYDEISKTKIDEIINIGKSLEKFNYVILESLLKIVEHRIQKFKQKDQINFIEKNLEIYLKNEWFIESNNKYINLLWIINSINSRKQIYDVNKVNEIKQNNLKITDELGKRLINKLQENNMSLEMKIYNELMEDLGIKSIINLWEKNKLSFGKRISKRLILFPIVHKILIHRIVEGNIKNETLIKELIKSIDEKYIFYDITVKNFIDNYSQKYNLPNKLENYKNSHFKNEISITKGFWVKDKPFYLIDLDNLKYEEVEKKLIAAVKQTSFFEGEYYFSLEGQNKELLDSFEKSNLSNNEKKRLFKNLTENHVISENYTRAIKRILIFGFSNKILTLKDINIFLEMNIKGKNLVEIDENLLNASEELIKKYGINTDKIFELFMTIDLSKNNELNLKSKDDIVDMTKFINSKIGKYFNIIAQCTLDNQNNKSKVKEKIEENNFIKNYLMGQFINLYEIEELPTKDINIFIGYSHKYILSNNSRYIDYFELAAKQIFENNMYNDFLYNNLTLILLEKINPILDINFYNVKKEKAKSIFKIMIDSYLNDNEYTYFKNWLEWFIENLEMPTTIINKIIEHIHLKRFEKLNTLLSMFKKLKISKKIKFSQISHIYKFDEFDKECLDFYYQVLLTLKNKNILIFDGESRIYIDYLFEKVNNMDSKELTKKFVNLLQGEFPRLN